MAERIVVCECGLEMRGEPDELFELVRRHGREAHNMDVTREQVEAMSRPADDAEG